MLANGHRGVENVLKLYGGDGFTAPNVLNNTEKGEILICELYLNKAESLPTSAARLCISCDLFT